METRVLALTGLSYCGKTTVSQMVCEADSRFIRVSFGTVLKKAYCAYNGVDLEATVTPRTKEAYRMGLVDFSKRVKEKEGWDYFARALFEGVGPEQYIVIDDLRFIEELDLCLKRDAVVFKVYSESRQRALRGHFPSPADADISETELSFLSGYDWWKLTGERGGVLYNTKDESYLRDQVHKVMQRYFPVALMPYKQLMQGVA